MHGRADIVDHHRGTAAGQLQRVQPAEPPAGTRDDRDLVGESIIGSPPFLDAQGAHRLQ